MGSRCTFRGQAARWHQHYEDYAEEDERAIHLDICPFCDSQSETQLQSQQEQLQTDAEKGAMPQYHRIQGSLSQDGSSFRNCLVDTNILEPVDVFTSYIGVLRSSL